MDGTKLSGPESLNAALMSRSQLFVTNVVEKMMTYALGRAIDYHDMPAVRAVVKQAQLKNDRFSALVLGIVQSTPFLQQAAPQRGANLTAKQ